MSESTSPIELGITPADFTRGARYSLSDFSSYSFDSNILVPASPFRFTAEGVDRQLRSKIRSGDLVELYTRDEDNRQHQLATGFIDETDVKVGPTGIAFQITGRDTVGQLVDNAAVDDGNRVIHIREISIIGIANELVKNTRIPSLSRRNVVVSRDAPNGKLLFQTNPGETKINALQRYLEFTNCLVWSLENGLVAIGKPNFAQRPLGKIQVSFTKPEGNNVLEARVRRAPNHSIRKIAVLLQDLSITDPSPITIENADRDVQSVAKSLGGKSVLRLFGLGNGMDSVNQLVHVGNRSSPQAIGQTLARRELARANMEVLNVEVVMRGHIHEGSGLPYRIDQVYEVLIEDDDVRENMYVHSARYDLTKDHGRTTTLQLCKLGTIVADVAAR